MTNWSTLNAQAPRIIAHRGASGLRPEHTIEGYELAIAQGADVIEPDLVPTRDGVLIARHERALSLSTDVASRSSWQLAQGQTASSPPQWFADEYDWKQLSELRAVQPFPGRSQAFDGQFAIPRFSDVLDLAEPHWRAGRSLSVYPEIKHPEELLDRGLDSTGLLITELQSRALAGPGSPVWVQCFEIEPLHRVFESCGNATFALFQHIDADWLHTLKRTAPWLTGVALSKANLIGAHAVRDLVTHAHDLGFQVHVWTLRDDLVLPGFADVDAEYQTLFQIGVDALFCDFPERGLQARARWGGR